MGCSPWGRKKVEHDLATKQQQPSWVHLFIHEPNQALTVNRWVSASGPGGWDCVPVPDRWALTIWQAGCQMLRVELHSALLHGWLLSPFVVWRQQHASGVSPGVMSLCSGRRRAALRRPYLWGLGREQTPQTCWRRGQLHAGCRKCQNNEPLQPGGLGTPLDISPVCSGMFSMVDLASDLWNTLKIVFT